MIRKQILDHMLAMPGRRATLPQLVDALGVSHPTASKAMRELVALGYAIPDGRGFSGSTVYKALRSMPAKVVKVSLPQRAWDLRGRLGRRTKHLTEMLTNALVEFTR